MLDINWIKANPAAFDAALKERKNVPFKASELIAMDESAAPPSSPSRKRRRSATRCRS